MIEDRRRRSIPGIEKYSLYPHTERDYRRYFTEAYRVLSHSIMPEEMRKNAEELAVSYASSKTEESFGLENDIKIMAKRILETGDEMIIDRGWSYVPDDNNFAYQLKGNSENASSLKLAARTGKPIDLVKLELKERRMGQTVRVAFFKNIPDLRIGTSSQLSMTELMCDFSLDFLRRLGFLSQEEELSSSSRVKKYGKDAWKILHPTQPFHAFFGDFSPRNSISNKKRSEQEETEIRAIKEVLDEFFPSKPTDSEYVIFNIELYHQEKSRSRK